MRQPPEPLPDADPPEARLCVGRRHVSDEAGDPLVIDWRAGLAHPFYRVAAFGGVSAPRTCRAGPG